MKIWFHKIPYPQSNLAFQKTKKKWGSNSKPLSLLKPCSPQGFRILRDYPSSTLSQKAKSQPAISLLSLIPTLVVLVVLNIFKPRRRRRARVSGGGGQSLHPYSLNRPPQTQASTGKNRIESFMGWDTMRQVQKFRKPPLPGRPGLTFKPKAISHLSKHFLFTSRVQSP